MSLQAVTDSFLAARAAAGDGTAFAELARRYEPLIWNAARNWTPGLDYEDERQEALIGLFDACIRHDPARARFARFAAVCVHSRLSAARRMARARKQQPLNEAVLDGEEPTSQLAERVPAGPASDPTFTVELRDELRERTKRARQPRPKRRDLRRRYSDEQVSRALELIAEGKTLKEVAWAVGAPTPRVRDWVNQAGVKSAGRRNFTRAEIGAAVELVHAGASLRQAAAAVGASSPAVLRWVRQAA